jgi:ATP-dependent DNA ligase
MLAKLSDELPSGDYLYEPKWDGFREPLRIERVCEVKYDHMQGDRFRHAAIFLRWRPDKQPQDCRYDQLEVSRPYELEKIFASQSR